MPSIFKKTKKSSYILHTSILDILGQSVARKWTGLSSNGATIPNNVPEIHTECRLINCLTSVVFAIFVEVQIASVNFLFIFFGDGQIDT